MLTIAPMKTIISVLHESGSLNLGSFIKSMSWHANVIIIDGKKQALNEVETLVRRVSSRLQKWRRQQNKIHRKF